MLYAKMIAMTNTGKAVATANIIGNTKPAPLLAERGISAPKYKTPLVGQNAKANKIPSSSAPQPPRLAIFSPLPLKPNFGNLNLLPTSINSPIINNAGPTIISPYVANHF